MIDLLIAYYRLSKPKKRRRNGRTVEEIQWGWSLDAQQAAVAELAQSRSAEVLASYQELETGRGSKPKRPELAKAISHAKRARATLCIAVIDRLARNVHFVSGLMESGVDFVCCDNPFATPLTIHIHVAVAEDEARRISARTKAGLAAAKARGVLLGAARLECRNLTDEARRNGAVAAGQAARERADQAYVDLKPLLVSFRPHLSLRQIAAVLNAKGERTARGCEWTSTAVLRVCGRLGI